MDVKITKLTAMNVQALRECLTAEEAANVTLTATTATFAMTVADAAALVGRLQGRIGDKQGHPYQSLHAVARKLQQEAASRRSGRVAGPDEYPELRSALRLS